MVTYTSVSYAGRAHGDLYKDAADIMLDAKRLLVVDDDRSFAQELWAEA